MSGFLYIYLAGNIKKGKEDENEDVWTSSDMQRLQAKISEKTLIFLNPAHRSDDLSDQKSVFGRDMFQVYSSDLLFVDARGKRGLGVGAEMMFAKMNHIPVITWVPENSHYHRSTIHLLGQYVSPWVHPFVFSLSDCIAPSLEHAAEWINNVMLSDGFKSKGPHSLKECMHHYLSTQLDHDAGMHDIVSSHVHFDEKINDLEYLTQMR